MALLSTARSERSALMQSGRVVPSTTSREITTSSTPSRPGRPNIFPSRMLSRIGRRRTRRSRVRSSCVQPRRALRRQTSARCSPSRTGVGTAWPARSSDRSGSSSARLRRDPRALRPRASGRRTRHGDIKPHPGGHEREDDHLRTSCIWQRIASSAAAFRRQQIVESVNHGIDRS